MPPRRSPDQASDINPRPLKRARMKDAVAGSQGLKRTRDAVLDEDVDSSWIRKKAKKLKNRPEIAGIADARPAPLQLSDVECVSELGEGAFGKVMALRVKKSRSSEQDRPGALLAIKSVTMESLRGWDYSYAREKNEERTQMVSLPWSPFITNILSAFSDARNLYLALELIPGGNLLSVIRFASPMNSSDVRFYLSNIVCGLEFLHSNGVVHRDMKPANILVGADGYLCIADFGNAQPITLNKHWEGNGTWQYMAPELHFEHEDEFFCEAVDWWAVGCILYEMVTKRPAFLGNDLEDIYSNIEMGLSWPSTTFRPNPALQDLVSKLLTRHVADRIGTNNTREVQEHSFFDGLAWDKVRERQYPAPWLPQTDDFQSSRAKKPLPERHRFPGLPLARLEPLYRNPHMPTATRAQHEPRLARHL